MVDLERPERVPHAEEEARDPQTRSHGRKSAARAGPPQSDPETGGEKCHGRGSTEGEESERGSCDWTRRDRRDEKDSDGGASSGTVEEPNCKRGQW